MSSRLLRIAKNPRHRPPPGTRSDQDGVLSTRRLRSRNAEPPRSARILFNEPERWRELWDELPRGINVNPSPRLSGILSLSILGLALTLAACSSDKAGGDGGQDARIATDAQKKVD